MSKFCFFVFHFIISCSCLYEICVIHEKRGDHIKANDTFHILSAKLRDIGIESEFYNDKNGKESIQLEESLMKYRLVEKNVLLFADVVKIVGKVIQRYDYKLALQCLKVALVTYKKHLNGNSPRIEETLYLISINYTNLFQYEDALLPILNTLQIQEQRKVKDENAMEKSLHLCAKVHSYVGNVDSAISLFNKAIILTKSRRANKVLNNIVTENYGENNFILDVSASTKSNIHLCLIIN